MAERYPLATVRGFDLTPESVARARQLAELRQVPNVEFDTWNLMDGPPPGGPYDLVSAVGVVMHLADPAQGIRHLMAGTSGGEVLLWMYGELGRMDLIHKRELLSLVVRDPLDLEEKLHYAERLELLPRRRDNPIKRWLRRLLNFNQERQRIWQIDQIANVHEHNYRYRELAALLDTAGAEITHWAGGLPQDPAEVIQDADLLARVRELPRQQMYEFLELYLRPGGFCFFCRPAGGAEHPDHTEAWA